MVYQTLLSKDIIEKTNISEEMFNLLTKTYEAPDEFNYQILYVTKEYIARPDLLSISIYGNEDFADILCKLNGISNPFELNEGMCIVAPVASSLSLFYQVINSEESNTTVNDKDSKWDIQRNQKLKNQPRKANEQVVGDRNFRIDKNNKIIIY